MKKLVTLLTVFLVLASLSACKYATIVPDVPSPNVPVLYSTQIQPIFNSGCTCHKPGGPVPNLTAGSSYKSLMDNSLVVAGNASSSVLYQEITTGAMSAYCDATSAGLIKNWINQGALNN